MEYVEISRWYIISTILFLLFHHLTVKYLSDGTIGVAEQCGIWCAKHPILILILGIMLGHFFYQMPYSR